MSLSDFAFVLGTDKPFEQAVVAVQRAAEGHQWGVLGDYDFSEILTAKGFPQAERGRAAPL